MTAATLLDRLDGVRQAGPGRWMARCPAHQDRSPSLSVRETDNRILVHCFGGCEVGDVLEAVSLELSDLFDRPLQHHYGPVRDRRHRHAAAEALLLLAHESLLVALAAENLANGIAFTDDCRQRLLEAAVAIRRAREAVA